jgi:hypothetical protein
MAAEDTASHISGFDTALPANSGDSGLGDDNFRHIKTVLKTDFPNIGGAMTATHTELNVLDGVTSTVTTGVINFLAGADSSIQTQINANSALIATNIADIAANSALIATNIANIATKAASSAPTLTGLLTLSGTVSPTGAIQNSSTMASATTAALATSASIKAYIDAQVAAVAAVKQIITGYKNINTGDWSTGSGEDNRYYDIDITAAPFSGSAVTVANTAIHLNQLMYTATPNYYNVTARMTTTTNLRISSPVGAPTATVYVRPYIVEYN